MYTKDARSVLFYPLRELYKITAVNTDSGNVQAMVRLVINLGVALFLPKR